MEQALRDVLKVVPIGKILIQTNEETGEPEVSKLWKVFKLLLFFLFSSIINDCLKI